MTNDAPSGRAVLFDVDGTLLDTVPMIVESYQHVFRRWLGHPGDEAAIMASIGTPLEESFRQFPPDQAEQMKQDYLAYNRIHLDSDVGIFLGIPRILQCLRELGIPLGIVTSKRRESAMYSLNGFGLADYFQVFIVRESTSRHKPDPEPVYEAMRQLKLNDPGRVIFVGDSLHDLYCARQAGCHSAIVDWTAMPAGELKAAGPDLWLAGADQLIEYLAKI